MTGPENEDLTRLRFPAHPAPSKGLLDDATLVGQALRGRLDAFEELVRRYQLPVYRVALRMLSSTADAEDAAQEAFLSAWRALPGFRSDSEFRTWLYRIVANQCLRTLGRRRATDELPAALVDPAGGPEEMAAAAELVEAVRAAVAELTPEQRAPWVLREIEGLSYEEIAAVLELSLPAVKARLHRARAQIMRSLGAVR